MQIEPKNAPEKRPEISQNVAFGKWLRIFEFWV
jgi:hypothetical protein